MGILIEQGPEGPSKLDLCLEKGYKDSEIGDIMISPEEATKVLLRTLLGFYRGTNETNPKIEALAYIIQQFGSIAGGQTTLYNYTDIKEGFDRKRQEYLDYEQRIKNGEITRPITPKTPPQSEI